MNANKWLNVSKAVALAMALMMLLAAGLSLAQEPDEAENGARQADEMQSAVANRIPVQGRLTDSGGNPLSGTYDITFSLYDASTGGNLVCADANSVDVNDGLFTSEIWGDCSSDDVDGRQLYLGIKVGSDPEMTPRQAIYPAPYAFSLKPGAIISASRASGSILHIENWGNKGRGLRAYAMAESGVNYGVVGASRSPNGYGGYHYNNGGGVGLLGETNVVTSFGVVGLQTGYSVSDLDTAAYWESAGLFGGRNGVVGLTKDDSGWGVFGLHDASSGGGTGVVGTTVSPDGWAARFTTGAGNGVYIGAPAGKVGLNVAGGTKNAVVATDDGARLLYTEESSEVWFADYGFGALRDGAAIIDIDPVFAQTVNLNDEPYHVFVQVYGNAEIYVSNRTPAGFGVHLREGDPNVEFSYRIVAKRLGHETRRLERAPWADDDPNLFPEKSAQGGGK